MEPYGPRESGEAEALVAGIPPLEQRSSRLRIRRKADSDSRAALHLALSVVRTKTTMDGLMYMVSPDAPQTKECDHSAGCRALLQPSGKYK